MINIKYNERYLPSNEFKNLYKKGKHILVDKTFCGNGATYISLNDRSYEDKLDVLIFPNRGAVQSKEKSYKANPSEDKIPTQFIYGGSEDRLNLDSVGKICIVADSFIYNIKAFKKHKNKLRNFTIDEIHKFAIELSYRPILISFFENLSKDFPKKAIVGFTASPMLFQNTEVSFTKDIDKLKPIYHSTNERETLNRALKDYEDGKFVMVATNNIGIIKQFAKGKDVLKAKFLIGNNLMQNVVSNINIENDDDSRLVFISSASFEGVDEERSKFHFYMFVDRRYSHQDFYIQNIYQALSRARLGTHRIEVFLMFNENRKNIPTEDEIHKTIKSKRISNEKKFTDRRYKYIQDYCIKEVDLITGLIYDIKFIDDMYNTAVEQSKFDSVGFSLYDEYLAKRGYKIEFLNNGYNNVKHRAENINKQFETLKLNKEIIKDQELFENLFLFDTPQEYDNQYWKSVEKYMVRYWRDLPINPFKITDEDITDYESKEKLSFEESLMDLQSSEVQVFKNKDEFELYKRQMRIYSTLKDDNALNKLSKALFKALKREKMNKYDRRHPKYIEWVKNTDEKLIKQRVQRMLVLMVRNRFKAIKKMRNNRDFNILTEASLNFYKYLWNEFRGEDFKEYDIVSCNIRILYNHLGIELPDNIYGENKEHKQAINQLLNQCSSELPIRYRQNVPKYKKNRVADLRRYNIDDRVIEFIFSNFWNKKADAVYNFCASKERDILRELKSQLDEVAGGGSIVRRHDSLIVFGCHNGMNGIVEYFKWNECFNWFKKSVEKEVELVA
jgi:hypothetical protein